MTIGPVEYAVIGFPGNKFSGEIIPALRDLIANGTVHIVDIVFVKKDEAGQVQSFEFSELGPEEAALFDDIEGEINGIIADADIKAAADALPNNSSASLILWENTWATTFRNAVLKADGQLLMYGRIDHDFAAAALEA